jgi:hypothetical protein
MAEKDTFSSSKMAHPLITFEKCVSTSEPVSQVGGVVEWPLRSRILHPWIFSYGDSLKIECSYRLCLQMSLRSKLELLPQLQKWRQRCYKHVARNWLQVGRQPHYQWKSHWTTTVRGEARHAFLCYECFTEWVFKTPYMKNSVAWVREQTIPTERPLLVSDVSANFSDSGCHVISMMDPCGPMAVSVF